MFRYLSRWERAIGRQLRRVLGAAGGWAGRGRPRSPTSGSIACGPVDPELAPVVRLGGDLRNDEAVAGLYRQVVRLVSAGLSRVVGGLQGGEPFLGRRGGLRPGGQGREDHGCDSESHGTN